MNYEGYHKFLGESQDLMDEPGKYGSFEVFYSQDCDDESLSGWHWWTCQPGCLPEGHAHGPFESAEEAYNDAREQ